MKAQSTNRKKRAEEGIALLISIFVLLLISVVAIALVVSSGTESALAGNYRSSTEVYYAALSGLEEARGRLLTKNANSFTSTAPANFLPSPGNAFPMTQVSYVLNPGPTEDAANILTTYQDTEYDSEFGSGKLASAALYTTLSMWDSNPLKSSLNLPGPLYKWVRINAVSEQSLKLDTYPYVDGTKDPTPVYYDGVHLTDNNSAGPQVLELTALAVLPDGSQKMVQYLVAPAPIQIPPLPAALTLAGKITGVSSTVAYSSPSSNTQFKVLGTNFYCDGSAVGSGDVPAIGVFNSTDTGAVIGGIQPASVRNNNYVGSSGSPDVEVVYGSFPPAMWTPAGLEAALQPIVQNKDVLIAPTPTGTPPYLGTATGADLTPLGMSSTNPLTIVVNGNLDISNWSHDGYGLLLVTGTFTYDPDTNWYGIILVIGQGIVGGSHSQYKQINGAMLVAKTRDGNNNLLTGPDLADSSVVPSGVGASVIFANSMQGNGIRYSSCWIQKAQPTSSYKILSFHEIPSQQVF